jgi:hypothetical protein
MTISARQAHKLGFYRAPNGRLYADWRYFDPTLWLWFYDG